MNNTTLHIIEDKQNTPTGFTELELILLYATGVLLALLVLQSCSCCIYAMRRNRKRKTNRKHSCIPYIREPLPDEQNNGECYISRPFKQVSDPEIYESLKDLIEAPPLPPISTLPKRKPAETQKFLAKLSTSNLGDKDSISNTIMAPRPRQPLPNEIEAVRIMSGNNISQTMPRTQFPKPVPTPIMSSTISRFPNRGSAPKMRPMKPEILPPKPQPTSPLASPHIPVSPPEIRTLPKPKNPVEVPNKYTLPPPEPNHDIPVENELMQKLKKRAQLIPSSTNEIPVQQITNNPTRIQPQQMKNEPNIPNELMQKLKKRAALIPDSLNQKEMQQPINASHRVKTPRSKPPPPVPRRSDSEDTWVDYFDNRDASEQIHMYNI